MNENTGKDKITVIDDNEDLVRTIKQFLEERDFSVSFAYDGRSGLEVVKQEKPDLIILDVVMPDMDGRDVLVDLKKDENTKRIPVLMFTVKGEQFERDYGFELGAYEYIEKPYDGYRLLRQIKNILDKKKRAGL